MTLVGLPAILVAVAFVLMVVADAGSSQAYANSATCKRLQIQLASLKPAGRSRNGSAASRYRRAVRAQRSQINRVQSRMSAYGCRARASFFRRAAHPQCPRLRSSLRSMKRNLTSLERRAGRLNSGTRSTRNTARERRRILRRMRRANCGRPQLRTAKLKRQTNRALKRRGKNDPIFSRSRKNKIRTTEERLRNYNTYRTMCVRTCDGYKFPVSFSTKRRSFKTDAKACNNLCPGTEMELFYRRTAGETGDSLVSAISGKPYTTLPNAFAFQRKYNPQCSCNYSLLKPQINASAADSDLPRGSRKIRLSRRPLPVFRSRAMERARSKKPIIVQPVELFSERTVAQSRQIREVGDAFYPTQ